MILSAPVSMRVPGEPSPHGAVETSMDSGSDDKTNVLRRIGSQPVALAAGALIVLVLGVGSVGLWRAATGTAPEPERITSLRQMQARSTQASEQMVEKTRSLEASQQESIGTLTGAIDSLRQSFASAQSSEPSTPQVSRKSSSRAKPVKGRHAAKASGKKRSRS
jgi:uncharacterized protein HemX